MAMQAESLEILEKANVPSEQARAIVRAIEIELGGAKDTLATKHDTLLLRHDLSKDMTEPRTELRLDMTKLRTEMGQEMTELRTEMQQDMTELRTELQKDMTELRTELRQEVTEFGSALRVEIHSGASSTTRQMYAALLGQMAVLLGIAYFFVTNVLG
jgi:predicted  nucleic acid-binding Zn-ribbon protein